MCADIMEEGSFCIGDGGGPLVTNNTIVSKQYSLEKNLYGHFVQYVQNIRLLIPDI